MADDKDKDKQQYSYRPDIEYQDTYESDHINKRYQSVDANDGIGDADTSTDVMREIDKTFNEITKIMPLLPAELQTAINNIYKPVLDDWSKIRIDPYPVIIPDPDYKRYIPKLYDPEPIEPIDVIYPTPPEPPTPVPIDRPEDDYDIDNDGMWDADPPVTIDRLPVDPEEVIKKEYIKNVADLYNYYTNRLKNILYRYYSEKLMAVYAKKKDSSGNLSNKTTVDVFFMFYPITNTCADVDENSKHLFDASLAMGETASMKLCFLENAFPVDQTLLHLKSFKTIYMLRLRYAGIKAESEKDKINALSNNILLGMKNSYDQKYDVSFANLYKYLNSSLDILEDTINTELAGLKARRTLIEKGWTKK